MSEINIEEFINVDLRVAKIKEAHEVPDADKLVELILDVGELGEKRVFAGIKDAYELEDLTNKLVVVVNNLVWLTPLEARGRFLNLVASEFGGTACIHNLGATSVRHRSNAKSVSGGLDKARL